MRALQLVLPTLAYNVSIGLGNLAMTLRIIELGGNIGDVGLAAFVYNLFFALASPIWPITLIPKTGRKKAITLGMGITAMAFLLASIALYPYQIILLNILYGLGASMIPPALTMIFVEYVDKPRARAIGFFNQVTGLGWLVGLILGSIPLPISLHYLLLLASIIGMVAVILSHSLLPEPLGIIETRKIAILALIPWISDRARQLPALLFQYPKIGRLLAVLIDVHKSIRLKLARTLPLLNLGTIILFTAIGLFFTAIPVYLKNNMGLSNNYIFTLNTVAAVVSTVFFTYVSRIAESDDRVWSILLAAVGSRITLFLIPIAYANISDSLTLIYVSLIILFMLFGATWSMIAVSLNTIVVSLAEPNRRDERLGQLNTMISVGIILGSILAGITGNIDYTLSFTVSGVLAGIALVIYYKAKTTIIV